MIAALGAQALGRGPGADGLPALRLGRFGLPGVHRLEFFESGQNADLDPLTTDKDLCPLMSVA